MSDLNTTDRRILDTQDHFLKQYSECGAILKAGKATHIGRTTVYDWINQDKLGFQGKFQAAKESFREKLEDIALERIRERDEKANPLLLITMLLKEIREMQKEWKQSRLEGASDVISEAEQILQDNRTTS